MTQACVRWRPPKASVERQNADAFGLPLNESEDIGNLFRSSSLLVIQLPFQEQLDVALVAAESRVNRSASSATNRLDPT